MHSCLAEDKLGLDYLGPIKQFNRIRVSEFKLEEIDTQIDIKKLNQIAIDTFNDAIEESFSRNIYNPEFDPILEKKTYPDSLKTTGQLTISLFTKPYLSHIHIFFLIEAGNYIIFQDDIYEKYNMLLFTRLGLDYDLSLYINLIVKEFAKTYLNTRESYEKFKVPPIK